MDGTRFLLGAALALVVAGAVGCTDGMVANPKEMVVTREMSLDGKTVVVVPFRDKDGAYFGSETGTELAERLQNQMRGHLAQTRFVSALTVRQKLEGEALTGATVQDLGKAAGANVVIVGEIREFRTADEGAIGYLRGTCELEVKVCDANTGGVLKEWSPTLHYPERGAGIASTDTTEAKMRDSLLKHTADTLAKKFYTYKRSNQADPIDW